MRITASVKEVMRIHVLCSLVFIPLCFVSFHIVNGLYDLHEIIGLGFLLLLTLLTGLGFLIHEFIHAMAFFLMGVPIREISFGRFSWYAIYTHCGSDLARNRYLFVVFMPFLLLGVIPLITAFVLNSFLLFCLSILMIGTAYGDLVLGYKVIRTLPENSIVDLDGVDGFEVFDSEQKSN